MDNGVIIIGNGGHARACVDAWNAGFSGRLLGCTGFDASQHSEVPYLGADDVPLAFFGAPPTEKPRVFVAVGDNALRERLTLKALTDGFGLATLLCSTAQVGASAQIGAGAAVMRGAIVGAFAQVGAGAIINTGASIDHDCQVGAFAHIAPGARLAGTVTVGERAMIGVGACVIPGISIGADATVGAGAAVIRDVPAGATVVGVPAREIHRVE